MFTRKNVLVTIVSVLLALVAIFSRPHAQQTDEVSLAGHSNVHFNAH